VDQQPSITISSEKGFPIAVVSESMDSIVKEDCPKSVGIVHPRQIYCQHMRAKGHVKKR
jgi:hypothetical protein